MSKSLYYYKMLKFMNFSKILIGVETRVEIELDKLPFIHYKRKGCFKYSPRDKILSNELFRKFVVRNTCLFSKENVSCSIILLKRHVVLTENLLKRSLLKILYLRLYLKHPFLL